jgi:hypothetical protein
MGVEWAHSGPCGTTNSGAMNQQTKLGELASVLKVWPRFCGPTIPLTARARLVRLLAARQATCWAQYLGRVWKRMLTARGQSPFVSGDPRVSAVAAGIPERLFPSPRTKPDIVLVEALAVAGRSRSMRWTTAATT